MAVREHGIYNLPSDDTHKEFVARRAQPGLYVLLQLATPRDYLVVLGDQVVDPKTLNVVCQADDLLQLQYPTT
jgi:hypothetical protein